MKLTERQVYNTIIPLIFQRPSGLCWVILELERAGLISKRTALHMQKTVDKIPNNRTASDYSTFKWPLDPLGDAARIKFARKQAQKR